MFAAGKTDGAAAAVAANYIEDVFSTYLYTGNSGTQTITNGIDLSTKGGLVWTKKRAAPTSGFGENHNLVDTARGVQKGLASNRTDEQDTNDYVTAFGTTGYTIGNTGQTNQNGDTYVSWTFRKQPKFFDIVTWTGNDVAGRQIAHSLGSAPGCIIVKSTSNAIAWQVYHRSTGATDFLVLNTTAAKQPSISPWNNTAPTSSVFTVGDGGGVNLDGVTYVAYLFAHDAGGFGLTGTDNVISCGSFTTVSSGYSPNVELGYEPQWVMLKRTDSTGAWLIVDTMRGWVNPAGTAADDANLRPNVSDAEATNDIGWPYATGFNAGYRGGAESTWIYIAIRRGPMKVPTSGTSVFAPVAYTGNGTGSSPPPITTNFPVDMTMWRDLRTGVASSMITYNSAVFDRLRGNQNELTSSATDAEDTSWGNSYLRFDSNTSILLGSDVSYLNKSGSNYVSHAFKRAPSFFDVVCFTGTSSTNQRITHNLTVPPELIISKVRDGNNDWYVYVKTSASDYTNRGRFLLINNVGAFVNYGNFWGTSNPTSTDFGVNSSYIGYNGLATVNYLFATLTNVSKVGSYTGNGTTQTIDCGFGAGGARFVLIKRTDSTGDWYTYDTARGMTVLTDPYLRLNSNAAETATLGSVTTVSTGFAVNASVLAAINTNGANYIFLAIA
jgi:hypothetical protein